MKRVIVTGANGFLGSSLIKKLIGNGVEVVAIDITFANSGLPVSEKIVKLEMGINDVEKLVSLIPEGEYDVLYHFAWRGVNGPDKADPSIQLNNIQMAINCAIISKQIGCRKLLCAGTVAEQAVKSLSNLKKTSDGMMYGVAKHCTQLMLESYCKNIGLSFVWIQFSNIYGVGNKTGNLVSYTLGELMAGKEATFGPAEQPYDFIYVDDLIEAIYRIGEAENRHSAYYIGSGSPRILKEYLIRIGELCGKREKVGIGILPDDGIKYDFAMFDTTPLVQDVGEYVSTQFDEGIQKTIDWFKTILL